MPQQARDEAGNIWNVDANGQPTTLAKAAPRTPMVMQAPDQDLHRPKLQGDLVQTQEQIKHTALENQRMNAQQPFDARMAAAAAKTAEANASMEANKAADDALAHGVGVDPKVNSNLHGQAYFDANKIPVQRQELIKSLVQGNLPAGQRSIASKTMLPYIQDAVNFDPSFSTTTFQQRSDFFKNVIGGKDGLNLDAAGTAMGHAYAIRNALGDLNNHNGIGGVLDGLGNFVNNNFRRTPAVNNAQAQLDKFSKENAAAYGQSTGAERDSSKSEIPINSSPEQMYGTLKGDVNFFGSKLAQFDTKAKRVLGPNFDINTYLSPEAQQSMKYYHDLNVAGIHPDGTHDGDKPLPSALVAQGSAGFGAGGDQGSGGGSNGPPGGPPISPFRNNMSSGVAGSMTASGDAPGDFGSAAGVKMAGKLAEAYRNGANINDLNGMLHDNGFEPFTNPEAIKSIAARHPLNFAPPKVDDTRSGISKLAGSAATGSVGAYGLSAVDAATLGYADELAGGQTQLAKEYGASHFPGATLAGGVTGALAASSLIGKGVQAATAASPVVQALLGTGARGALSADALYGAGLGSGENNDNRLKGAITGGLSSVAGSLVGSSGAKAIGGAIKGVTDPAVQYLTDRGIPLSVGQVLGNRGFAGKMANKFESMPYVGDLVGARRSDGVKAFNLAAINDALAPINKQVTGDAGQAAVGQAQDAVSQAYRHTLSGVNVAADPQFVSEMGDALSRGRAVPVQGEQFGHLMDTKFAPLFAPGATLDGPGVQGAFQTLRGAKSQFGQDGAMGGLVADELGNIDHSVSSLLTRQAPQTADGLANANSAFAALQPINNASATAINSGNGAGIFTPAQLNRAVTTNTKSYGGNAAAARGENQTDLMRYGQEILPSSVPNSGTADRIAAMLLPAALGGGAYKMSDVSPETASILALLAAGSTKMGSKAIQNTLVNRPDVMKQVGQSIIGNSGVAAALLAPAGAVIGTH